MAPAQGASSENKESRLPGGTRIEVVRYLHTYEFLDNMDKKPIKTLTVGEKIRSFFVCSRERLISMILSFFPIINVVRHYQLKNYILGDVLSGLTAACLHFPQGLAFGILASLAPAYGLYTSFFPVVLYMIFGTSPHVSFGTNAVIALLTAEIVETSTSGHKPVAPTNTTTYLGLSLENTTLAPIIEDVASVEEKAAIAAGATCLVGVILLAMGVLRLGFLTTYMSTPFIGGFTTAAAFHITTSQVPKALGIQIPLTKGIFKIINVYIAIFSRITNTNIASLLISIISILILVLIKDVVNEKFKDKMKMPVPIDSIIVVIATIISHFVNFSERFGVKTVGYIPSGMPVPAPPNLEKFSDIIVESFLIAILVLVLTISLAKLCAQKHNYELNDNQEMVAYGISNLASSFFFCFPSCVAPPRTMILSSMGAKTTLNNLFTALFILLVIMVLGQLFTSLPVPVLAAMIIVAIKGLLAQVFGLRTLWNINRYDFTTWIATCASGILLDLPYGLLFGVIVSFFTVILQSQNSKSYSLERSGKEDLYLDADTYAESATRNISGVKIFRMESSLYFATAEMFRKRIFELLAKHNSENNSRENNSRNTRGAQEIENGHDELKETETAVLNINKNDRSSAEPIRFVIVDCLPINYIDLNGVNMLKRVVTEMKKKDVKILLARCSNYMITILENAQFFESFSKDDAFVDLCDAVAEAEH